MGQSDVRQWLDGRGDQTGRGEQTGEGERMGGGHQKGEGDWTGGGCANGRRVISLTNKNVSISE